MRKSTNGNHKKSKSKRRLSEVSDPQHDAFYQQTNAMNVEPLKNFEVPALNTLVDRFQKEIKTPVEIQTSIYTSKSHQRCLQHNNVSTLYCISDRKPLCVTCMYQNSLHKKHKVVPLNRATRDLQDQNYNNLMIVQQEIHRLDKLINLSNNNITRAEKEYPDIINKISEFYRGFQEALQEKMNDQIKHVQIVWQKMRYEYTSFSQQLSDIKIFIIENMREIKKREGQESALFNRNISYNLRKIEQILGENMCSYHENSFRYDLNKFRDIQSKVGLEMVLTSPFKEKVKRQANKNFSYVNQASHRILKNKENLDQPIEPLDILQKNPRDRSLSAKKDQNIKHSLQMSAKNRKRSASPRPIRYYQAVSAQRSPVISKNKSKS